MAPFPSDGALSLQAFGWCTAGMKCPKSHSVDFILDCQEARSSRRRKRRHSSLPIEDCENGSSVEAGPIEVLTGDVETPPPQLVNSDTRDGACPSLSAKRHASQKDRLHAASASSAFDVACDASCVPSTCDALPAQLSGCHRAGYDAFMTGFAFAVFATKYGGLGCTKKEIESGCCDGDRLATFANKLCLSGKDFPLQVVKGNFAKLSQAHLKKKELIGAVLG